MQGGGAGEPAEREHLEGLAWTLLSSPFSPETQWIPSGHPKPL